MSGAFKFVSMAGALLLTIIVVVAILAVFGVFDPDYAGLPT